MARISIDTTGEIYGATVTIADLAQYTPILSRDSDCLTIYEVEEAMSREWQWEIETWNYEYLTGYSAKFKDGSVTTLGHE